MESEAERERGREDEQEQERQEEVVERFNRIRIAASEDLVD